MYRGQAEVAQGGEAGEAAAEEVAGQHPTHDAQLEQHTIETHEPQYAQ